MTGNEAKAYFYLAMSKLGMREQDIDRILSEAEWMMEHIEPDAAFDLAVVKRLDARYGSNLDLESLQKKYAHLLKKK